LKAAGIRECGSSRWIFYEAAGIYFAFDKPPERAKMKKDLLGELNRLRDPGAYEAGRPLEPVG
jgi:hypothetical protein